MQTLTWFYMPTAILLGALHALEPGHAKTLTAAYLIGVKGTRRDALLLGVSVAATHSVVVLALSVAALWLGREAFTDKATYWLQIGSGVIVVLLGSWLMWKRWRIMRRRSAPEATAHHHHTDVAEHRHNDDDHAHGHSHTHGNEGRAELHTHDDDSHDLLDDDEHAAAHAATLPSYVVKGERPTALQVIIFGGAGGMIPCPASITVMLLALSVGEAGFGLVTVLGFSLGLAITLVGIGMAIVAGLSKLQATGRLAFITRQAGILSAGLVMLSGIAAIAMSLLHHV